MSNLIDSLIDKLEDLIYSNVTAPLDNKMLTILKPFLRSSLLLISEEVKKEIAKMKLKQYSGGERYKDGVDMWGDEFAREDKFHTDIHNAAIDKVLNSLGGT